MEEDDQESTPRITERPSPSMQESLESEVMPDAMEGEQTWPTEDELAEAEGTALSWTVYIVKCFRTSCLTLLKVSLYLPYIFGQIFAWMFLMSSDFLQYVQIFIKKDMYVE